jgi:hypothetical protein
VRAIALLIIIQTINRNSELASTSWLPRNYWKSLAHKKSLLENVSSVKTLTGMRVFSGCESSVGASLQWVPVFSGSQFWVLGAGNKCGGDASTGTSFVFDAKSHPCTCAQTFFRQPYPSCKCETQNWTHTGLCAVGCKKFRIENICAALNDRDLSSFSRPWPVKCRGGART